VRDRFIIPIGLPHRLKRQIDAGITFKDEASDALCRILIKGLELCFKRGLVIRHHGMHLLSAGADDILTWLVRAEYVPCNAS